VLLTQHVIAFLITGPPDQWTEVVFWIYYLLLFLISATIVGHFQFLKKQGYSPPGSRTVSADPLRAEPYLTAR